MLRIFCLAIALLAAAGSPAKAQVNTLSDHDLLRAMLSGRPLAADWFAPDLLDAVPLPHIQTVVDGIHAEAGARLRVSGDGERYYLWIGRHRVPVTLHRRADGRIAGLFFHPAVDTDLDLAAVLARLRALPGRVSYLVLRDGQVLGAQAEDTPLAIGSAFKLAVLAALKRQVDDGQARWDEVVRLEEGHRSLPTGRLQDWPEQAPLTLHTLAAAMIAESDNTATDALIDRLGRDAVATAAGMTLMLTTREFFQLKADPSLYGRFVSLGEAGRRALLGELAARPLPEARQVLRPLQQEAEWLMSTRRLCALMDEVLDLDVMRVEPGPADPQSWIRIGYKGGSEIGVMNLTSGLVDRNGRRFCASVTWNDDGELEQGRLADLYVTLLSVLRQTEAPSAE